MKIDAATYAETERRLGTLLGTGRDVLLLQGEAILVLEATARGLGGPGVRALNLVSGPYGEELGRWLAEGGAHVEHLAVPFDQALDPEVVRTKLAGGRFDVVSVVHAEAATGVVNPLGALAAAAHAAGAVIAVDAVASVGAEPLPIDDWGLDLVMIGPQKALGGPAGVCALVAAERGWAAIASNPAAPRNSILSLLDWKQRWIDAGRRRIPGYTYEYEMRALLEALGGLGEDVGLVRLIDRHQRARSAVRAGLTALGLELWVADEREAAAVVTLARPPSGVSVGAIVESASRRLERRHEGLLTPAPGPLAERALRVNHTGPAARRASVLAAVGALAAALQEHGRNTNLEAALEAAELSLSRPAQA
jgi:aspartate aminotransferase-like enzyme